MKRARWHTMWGGDSQWGHVRARRAKIGRRWVRRLIYWPPR